MRRAALFVLLPCLPLAAAAQPLSLERVMRLLDTPGLLAMEIEDHGLEAPLQVEDVRRLLEAGIPDSTINVLLAAPVDAVEHDGFELRLIDGVLHVRSVPGPEGSAQAPDEGSEPSAADSATGGEAPWEPLEDYERDHGVDVRQAPAKVLVAPNPFPAGATGLAGAVFVPARFGSPPSSFGTTIVTGQVQPVFGFVAPANPPFLVAPEAAPATRMIPVHTSRGVLWIPN